MNTPTAPVEYTLDYFIAKFEAIPETLWTTGSYLSPDGTCCCALGHLGVRRHPETLRGIKTEESIALGVLLNVRGYDLGDVVTANDCPNGIDGRLAVINGLRSPKDRVLALLKFVRTQPEVSAPPAPVSLNQQVST